MASSVEELQYLAELVEAVQGLADALPTFEASVGFPVLVTIPDDPSGQHFRYPHPNERTIQVLLFVRIVSGLSAILVLLRAGHMIEAGVVLRTLDDFIGDFAFLEDALANPNGPNSAQRKYIDTYFLEAGDPNKQYFSRTQKVQAAEARHLNPSDPHNVIQISRKVDNLYDTYVHGDYGPVMEIYKGKPDGTGGRFEVLGVSEASAVAVHRLTVAIYVQRAYALGLQLATRLELRAVAERLYRMGRAYSGTPLFEEL